MFGRKKAPVEDSKVEPGTSTMPETTTHFGTQLAQALEADGTTSDLADAIERLRDNEAQGTLEGLVMAVAEATVEPDPVEEPEGRNEPGPDAPHSLVERYASHFELNLDALRTAESNMVERMARNVDAFEAQRDHDSEELRQIRVAIEANEAAAAVVGMTGSTEGDPVALEAKRTATRRRAPKATQADKVAS